MMPAVARINEEGALSHDCHSLSGP